MPRLDGVVMRLRAADLRQLGSSQLHQHLDKLVVSTDSLLVESGNVGYDKNFAKIRLDQPFVPASSIVEVKIYQRDQDLLLARAVEDRG